MRQLFYSFFAFALLSLFAFTKKETPTCTHAPQWGFYAHRLINRMAVFTLPPEVLIFFKKNINYVEQHAVDPDVRRYASKGEAARHYIDLDDYGALEDVPKHEADAKLLYNRVFGIKANGDSIQLFGTPLLWADSVLKSGWVQSYTYSIGDELYSFDGHDLRQLVFTDSTQWDLDKMALYTENLLAFFQKNKIQIADYERIVGIDFLDGHGLLPYHLSKQYRYLVYAFKQKDATRILKTSADMGHYIGDAHVPLHTTSNYNGQKTGQVGIHGFWESRIPELFAEEDYDFFVGKAKYYEEPKAAFWKMVLDSHSAVDSVLSFEKKLRRTFPTDRQMCPDVRGRRVVEQPCPEFAGAYSDSMDGMVERRMRQAILALGSVWYSAWVDAGQPDLSGISGYNPSASDLEEEKQLRALFQAGKIIGREEPH